MTKKHFLYLLGGIFFWGIAVGLLAKLLFFDSTDPLPAILFFSIIATFFLSLLAMTWSRGFPVDKPKQWFFYPVLSVVGMTIWFFIEKLFGA